MESTDRLIISYDWITLVIASCLILLAIVKYLYRNEFNHLLTASYSDRYIKITINENPNYLLRITVISVYIIGLSLWLVKLFQALGISKLEFQSFLLTLTGISVFILGKRYLSKMVASILKFEEIIELIDYHRNTYRAVLGIFLLFLNTLIYYIDFESAQFVWIASLISIFIIFAYNFIILYTYSKAFIKDIFYFILYLCALEIAPYLLLYKYIMLLRAH